MAASAGATCRTSGCRARFASAPGLPTPSSGSTQAAFLIEPARPDRRSHVAGLLAIHRAVLELNHRIEALPGDPLNLGALAWAHWPPDGLVVDTSFEIGRASCRERG